MSRRRQPKKHDRPLHVCSLSLSALKEVERDLEDAQTTIDSLGPEEHFKARGLFLELNRLRWIQLSMQFNQHTQLQYIHQQNSDKSSNPKFRQILMRPLFNFWKEELIRDNWIQLHKSILEKAAEQRIFARADHFQRQRTILTSKHYSMKYDEFDKLTKELLGPIEFSQIDSFMTPRSANPRFQNLNHNYCSSDALGEWSDISEEEDEEEEEYDINGNIEKREINIETNEKQDDEQIDSKHIEPESDKEINEIIENEKTKHQKEESDRTLPIAENETIKEQTKKKRISPIFIILISVLLTIAIIGVYLFFKHNNSSSEQIVDFAATTEEVVYEDDCPEPDSV